MNKLNYIDSLRGFAVLAVLIVHCIDYGSNIYPDIIQSIVSNAGRGVQLFYVVSAFTLFLSLNNRSKQELNIYSNFFIRRIFRILPMFYIAIVYYLCERIFFGNLSSGILPETTIWSVVSSIFLFHGFSPYWINNIVPGGWSIAVEMCFYCLVPFLFTRIKNLNDASVAFLIAIVFQHTLHYLIKHILFADQKLMTDFLYYYLPSNIPVFICGIFLYFLVYTPKEKWRINSYIILIFSFIIIFQISTNRAIVSSHILYAIAFILLGYALSRKETRIIVNPFTQFIGKISYSMYLVHFAVLHWMNKLNIVNFVPMNLKFGNFLNLGIRYTILLVMSIIISYITYHLVEKPFQQIGKKIINKREAKA